MFLTGIILNLIPVIPDAWDMIQEPGDGSHTVFLPEGFEFHRLVKTPFQRRVQPVLPVGCGDQDLVIYKVTPFSKKVDPRAGIPVSSDTGGSAAAILSCINKTCV